MSFQAYLDTIKAKTGKGPDDFRALAAEKGLASAKAADIVAWLAQDFGLGRGHAMAIYALLKANGGPRAAPDDRLAKLFAGGKAVWQSQFDALLRQVQAFGDDVAVAPTDSYASLVRGKKKFAIVQPSAGHMDIGIKRKGADATERFAAAGSWNSMVTHRVRIADAAEVDAELIEWLRRAYDEAR
ncbi:DUF4287 domain-containing protein [Phreatobacter stygius]|uniref:DUF4287 domain-containing protein n=1 Tax=Phreatobacter stygius TaxID=1940610 RepID=A0A4D7AV26_9HYPH|nr:DUF4287 domain-containing protein [Phreatobacter stygius]QCI62828.1 DUF4287 domain-containing protein [Phreatobacter stygius]